MRTWALRSHTWLSMKASVPPPRAPTPAWLPLGPELEESNHQQLPASLPPFFSLFPAEPFSFALKKKKKVDSVPALLKPNMSVIDEAVFFNFKGEGAVSECGPGELKSPRRQETHGVTLPSGGAPPIPPLLVPCKGTDNAIFNKS